jgi:hypothetical protein
MRKKFSLRMLFVLLIALSASAANYAQNPDAGNDDLQLSARAAQTDMSGKFSVRVMEQNSRNYYLVDFTKLNGRFQKVWFMNLTFEHHWLVNLDPDIDSGKVWFFTASGVAEKQVTELFDKLLRQTLETSARFSMQEKEDWLKKNDKYQK